MFDKRGNPPSFWNAASGDFRQLSVGSQSALKGSLDTVLSDWPTLLGQLRFPRLVLTPDGSPALQLRVPFGVKEHRVRLLQALPNYQPVSSKEALVMDPIEELIRQSAHEHVLEKLQEELVASVTVSGSLLFSGLWEEASAKCCAWTFGYSLLKRLDSHVADTIDPSFNSAIHLRAQVQLDWENKDFDRARMRVARFQRAHPDLNERLRRQILEMDARLESGAAPHLQISGPRRPPMSNGNSLDTIWPNWRTAPGSMRLVGDRVQRAWRDGITETRLSSGLRASSEEQAEPPPARRRLRWDSPWQQWPNLYTVRKK